MSQRAAGETRRMMKAAKARVLRGFLYLSKRMETRKQVAMIPERIVAMGNPVMRI
jgi:hypothetical protein